MKLVVVNLESGLPTVPQARIRLEQALRHAKSQQQPALKLIHGYGSKGRGGAIKQDVHLYLAEQKTKGLIKNYLPGEEFSPFSPTARELLSSYPSLYKDADYSRDNYGITMVLI